MSGEPAARPYTLPAILLLQTGLFLYDHFINFKPLWIDEAFSALMARKPFSEIHAHLVYDAGPPLYYDLLHLWRGFFGESELALRLLSLLFGLLSTILLYRFAARWLAPRAAGWAALIWAAHPAVLFYSTQARNYTLLIVLFLVYLDALLCYLKQGKAAMLALLSLALTLSVYNHNTGWFVGMAGGLSVLYLTRDWKRIAALFAAHLVPVILYIPWMPTLMAQMENTEKTLGWIDAIWSPVMPLFSPFTLMTGLTLHHFTHIAVYGLASIALVAWIAAYASLLKRIRRPEHELTRWLHLVAGLLVALPWAQSLLSQPTYILLRTDFVVLPILALGAGQGAVHWSHSKAWRYALGFAFLWPALIYSLGGAGSPQAAMLAQAGAPVNEGVVADYIQRQAEPGDVVLCTGLSRPVLEYELAPHGFRFVSYPPEMERELAHINESWYLEHLDLAAEARASINQALEASSPSETVWVAGIAHEMNKPLFDALKHETALRGSHQPIQSPQMGLRLLGTPVFLLRYERIDS